MEVRFHTFLVVAVGRLEYSVSCSGCFTRRSDVYPLDSRPGALEMPPGRGSKARNIFLAAIDPRFFSRLHGMHHTCSNKLLEALNVAVCCLALQLHSPEVPAVHIGQESDFVCCSDESIFRRVREAVANSDHVPVMSVRMGRHNSQRARFLTFHIWGFC